ncbi:hypothetical protein BDAP_000697 [Binucleata daphniae]
MFKNPFKINAERGTPQDEDEFYKLYNTSDDSDSKITYKTHEQKQEHNQDKDKEASYSESEIASDANYKPNIEKQIDIIPPTSAQAEANIDYVVQMGNSLNKSLGLKDEIATLADEKKWKDLYTHMQKNIDKYMFDGKLSIQLHIRYFACCFIVAFIPAEFIFAYPNIWEKLIPAKTYTIPILGDGIKEYRFFESFVKSKKDKSFLVTFYLGRKNTAIEDLKFLISLPRKIFYDPMSVLRELLDFEIRSEGYEEWRKNAK